MSNFKKLAITTVAIMVGVLLILAGFIATRGILVGLWDIPAKLNWKEKTTPLDPTVVGELCVTFSLPSDDKRCQPDNIVYAPEFFDVIRKTFAPRNGAWATYEEVQKKIGKYQYRFEPPVTQADGTTYFVVGYDLAEDRVYPIGMFFHGDGRLFRIVADVGD
jgi:hypothetical protein